MAIGRVVDATLVQGLAEALSNAALDLSLDDHRIDHGADVVYAPIGGNANIAGLAIDLDLAGVRAVAPRKTGRVIERAVLQPEFFVRRIEGRDVGDPRDLPKRDAAVGAGDGK